MICHKTGLSQLENSSKSAQRSTGRKCVLQSAHRLHKIVNNEKVYDQQGYSILRDCLFLEINPILHVLQIFCQIPPPILEGCIIRGSRHSRSVFYRVTIKQPLSYPHLFNGLIKRIFSMRKPLCQTMIPCLKDL